jgi:hypothetical protein
MASPHPTEGRCFYQDCGGAITDIWAEFLETHADNAAVSLGKADFTCPYCGRPLRFDARTNRIVAPGGGEPIRYHHEAAAQRAKYENTSIFDLMRAKGMVKAGIPAFLGYRFQDRHTPLTNAEGDTVHEETNP